MWLHCSSFQFHQACFSLIIDCYHLSLIHRIDLQDIALLIYNSVKFPNLTVGTVVEVSVAISFYYFFYVVRSGIGLRLIIITNNVTCLNFMTGNGPRRDDGNVINFSILFLLFIASSFNAICSFPCIFWSRKILFMS